MTRFTVYIPQHYRIRLGLIVEPGHGPNALSDFALRVARSTQPAQITFYISGKYGHSRITELFSQALKGDSFARSGGTRDQTVTICQAQRLSNRLTGKVSAK